MRKYISSEVPQSSICNLDCVYCYIPKNKILNKVHKKWAEKIRNGTHYETMSEYFPDGLTAISFWGGEPTLGFKDLERLTDLLDFNKNLTQFSTSTNFAKIEGLEFLLKTLNDYQKKTGRQLSFDLQISIDGTKENTEKNRGIGTYDRTVNNLKRLKEFSKEIDCMFVNLHCKPTNMAEDYKNFAENPQTLMDFLDSFNYLNNFLMVNLGVIDYSKIGICCNFRIILE